MYPLSPSCQIQNLSKILEEHIGSKTDGIFVEVGAHDGYSWSNTWGLAEIGWRGLCYEPVKELAEACTEAHKHHNVKVIQSCIGDIDGTVKLWLNENSTIDEETVELSPWDLKYDPDNFVMSPCVTLNTALKEHDIPTGFDLLSIDVEGAEMQVLHGFDINVWHPTMIILETHNNSPFPSRSFHAKALLEYMSHYPYTIVNDDGLNTIYVHIR